MPVSPHTSISLLRRPVALGRLMVIWALLLAFYFLCTGSVSLTEAIAGVVVAGFAAWIAVRVHSVEDYPQTPKAPWWRVVGGPLAALVPDSWRAGRVMLSALLGRGPEGVVAHQPFRHGSDNPTDAARRALVTLGASLAPNGIVVAIPGDTLVLHRLAAVAARADREWPV